jgi:S-DNA-T family DNA segregation ATPase FtsK/SpoIIIE
MAKSEGKVKNALKDKEKAKAKSSKKTKAKKSLNTSFELGEKYKRVFGLALVVVSLYLFLAMISYLISWFSWSTDDIFSNIGFSRILFDTEIEVRNWTGRLGAALAHIFVKKWFGLASFLILVNVFVFGIYLLLDYKIWKFFKALNFSIFSIVWISILLGFIISNDKFLILAGVFGYNLSEYLIGFVGNTGTAFLLFFALLSFTIIAFNFKFNDLLSFFSKNSTDKFDEESFEKTDGLSVEELASLDGIELESNISDEDKDENISQKTEDSDDEMELTIESHHEEALEDIKDEKPEPDPDNKEDFEMEVALGQESDDVSDEDDIESSHGIDTIYDPKEDLKDFQSPNVNLLQDHGSTNEIRINKEELEENKNKIVKTLGDYGIKIEKIKATVGPTITLYEIVPAAGIRISKIRNLGDDIALSLAALGIRIIAPIPGKGTIGIEVPNKNPEIVSMKTILSSEKYRNTTYDLPIGIGKTISNETFVFDLAKMPHLLIAGATGQGKSVGINAIITSLLYKKHPAQLKFVMVDPKKVELSLFSKIERHYLAKLPGESDAIITDVKDVVTTLNSLCIEMDERYDLLKDAHVRNIKEYNVKFVNRKLNPEKGHRYLPYIVLIVDEFADLIMTAGKEVESPIARLAQLARAIGIHLIIATQRPSVKIITGVIKANFPARIAFRVTSLIDSRTILDSKGAEQLVGKGDMLFSTGKEVVRLQCAFVDTPEVEEITNFIGEQRGYLSAMELPEYVGEESEAPDIDPEDRDELFEEAARLLVENQHGSTSLIQRKLKLGYNRAGRIIDQLESAGIVGPFKGSKAREVLFQDLNSLEQYLNNL